jgi:cell division protein FtsW
VAPAALLTGVGIIMIYSATAPLAIGEMVPPQFVRHLVAVGFGLVCALIATRIPLVAWRRIAIPLWAACVVLLAATLVVGVEVNGARRWLAFPGVPVRLQPAEIAKWATVLAIAALLAKTSKRSERSWRAALALVVPPVGLLLLQPDFGSAALVLVLVALMLFAAGMPLRRLVAAGAAACVGTCAYAVLRPYALARWKGFLDPWQTAGAEGFQLVQSFVAFGRGGSFGVGLGGGRQKLFYLPEAHTDFILSVVAEELGLVGVLLVLGAFAALIVAGTRIARRARDPFALLVAFGMTALIVTPAAVNAAVVMGLLPTTGFPLPFLSLGGNSLITSALALGILLRIGSREAAPRGRQVAGAAPRGLVAS